MYVCMYDLAYIMHNHVVLLLLLFSYNSAGLQLRAFFTHMQMPNTCASVCMCMCMGWSAALSIILKLSLRCGGRQAVATLRVNASRHF